jgi:hypothetical protein
MANGRRENMELTKYKHKEAFCLMQYRDQITGEIETLWNSRDGVTPFIIRSRKGNEAQHVNWRNDQCMPNFIPRPGMRIFVDASSRHGHIRDSARDYVDKYWDLDVGAGSTMSTRLCSQDGQLMTKGQAIEFFIAEWTKPGSPTVIEAEA